MTPIRASSLITIALLTGVCRMSGAADANSDTDASGGVDACASSAQEGQALRDEGHLLSAREKFRACLSAECPGVIRRDCDAWLAETESKIPSAIFHVRQTNGADAFPTSLVVDNRAVESADGRAVAFDPGAHKVTATVRDLGSISVRFVLSEGEKGRVVDIVFPPKAEPAKPLLLPITFATVGAVAVACFGYFGLHGLNGWTDLQSGCKPHCSDSDIRSVKRDFVVADVSLGVAIVAFGAAIYFFLAPPAKTRQAGWDRAAIQF